MIYEISRFKATPSDVLFWFTNSSKHKDIQLTVIEKLKIWNLFFYILKYVDKQLSKLLLINFILTHHFCSKHMSSIFNLFIANIWKQTSIYVKTKWSRDSFFSEKRRESVWWCLYRLFTAEYQKTEEKL